MNEHMLHEISDESVERLYWANQLRDYLNTNSAKLKEMYVTEVVLFGSVSRGQADAESDMDINFILLPEQQVYKGGDHPLLVGLKLVKFMKGFIKKNGFILENDVSENAPKNGKRIHILFSRSNDNQFDDDENYIKDKTVLWSDSE